MTIEQNRVENISTGDTCHESVVVLRVEDHDGAATVHLSPTALGFRAKALKRIVERAVKTLADGLPNSIELVE